MGTHYRGGARETRVLDALIKLTRAANTVRHRLAERLGETGLTESQLAVLELLLHLGPQCQREIGRKLLVSRANVTLIVDRLSGLGWVRRCRETHDRRLVRVELTPEGRRRIQRAFPEHVASAVEVFSPLTAAEQKDLARLCRKLGRANSGSPGGSR